MAFQIVTGEPGEWDSPVRPGSQLPEQCLHRAE